MKKTVYIQSPLGIVKICGTQLGVSEIKIEGEEVSSEVPEDLKQPVDQLNSYFGKKLEKFSFKINPEGTPFQKKVWEALLQIPFGKTISYLQLSKEMGDVKAIRAVAAANGKNPLWIVVPCHRVIGTNGSLTGYAGGLWRKKWLLEHENPSAQQSLF